LSTNATSNWSINPVESCWSGPESKRVELIAIGEFGKEVQVRVEVEEEEGSTEEKESGEEVAPL
jgi:hypothetical protein